MQKWTTHSCYDNDDDDDNEINKLLNATQLEMLKRRAGFGLGLFETATEQHVPRHMVTSSVLLDGRSAAL